MAATLKSLERLIKLVDMPGKLKICLDLCHVLQEFDITNPTGRSDLHAALEELGYEHIAAVHVSDSVYPHGYQVDKHAK